MTVQSPRGMLPVIDGSAGLQRRGALQALGGLVLSLGARGLAWGASIVAVRVWPALDYSRITIESDAPLTEKHFLLQDPMRPGPAPARPPRKPCGLRCARKPALRNFLDTKPKARKASSRHL